MAAGWKDTAGKGKRRGSSIVTRFRLLSTCRCLRDCFVYCTRVGLALDVAKSRVATCHYNVRMNLCGRDLLTSEGYVQPFATGHSTIGDKPS